MSNRNAMTSPHPVGAAPQEARRRALDRPGDRRLRRDEARRGRAVHHVQHPRERGVHRQQPASPRSTATAATPRRSCRSSRCPKGTTVDSPGVTGELRAALAKVEAAVPGLAGRLVRLDARPRLRLRGRPHDVRARLDPGTGAASIPGRPRRARRRRRSPASPWPARRSASRASTRSARPPPTASDARRREPRRRGARRRRRRPARPGVRLRLVDGDRPAADGDRRHPDDVPADLAAGDAHRRLGHRQVPGRPDRPGDRHRLRAAGRRALARGAPAREHDQRGRRRRGRWSTPAAPSSSAAAPSPSRCSRSSRCPCRSCAASASPGC